MTSETAVLEPTPVARTEDRHELRRTDRDRRRFTIAVAIGFAAVTVPFLWILWDLWTGTLDPTRQYVPDNFYDLQARAMFHGHLYLPNGSIGIEAFVHDGHQYTYFGLFPSLLRMPLLAVTNSYDGQLTAPSMLLAWLLTGLFTALLLWRVRVLLRGAAVLGRLEAGVCGLITAAVTGGSVLMYLASQPHVSDEDLAWSVALTVGALFALLGVLERPTRGRILASGVLVLCAALDRGSTGYACILAALIVAGWFALGRGGDPQRRWAVPMAAVGLVPLLFVVAIDELKFGNPFGYSLADQVWTQVNAHRAYFLAVNGGTTFGLHFLPSTLAAYFSPNGIHLSSAFPYITLPTTPAQAVGRVVLDQVYPTDSIPASMPLVFLLACWGLVASFRPRPLGRARLVAVLLVPAAAAAAGVMIYGYIADRYLGDFLPFLIFASLVGVVDLWHRVARRSPRVRGAVFVGVAALGLFGIWANIGAAVTPSALWTPAQARAFVSAQRSLSGGSVQSLLRQGRHLPYFAPAGTLFAVNGCTGLYVSTGFGTATVPGEQLQHGTWDIVEQGPGINHTLRVVFDRVPQPSDPPVTLMTYGQASLVLQTIGVGQVRLALVNAGASDLKYPSTVSDPLKVRPDRRYQVTVMTDPNLNSIVISGMGYIDHYIAGSGPAVIESTGGRTGNGLLSVTDISRPAPPTKLCDSLVGHPSK